MLPNPKKKPVPRKKTYMEELAQRGKESHVYRKYQLIGLEISQILADEKHKALYIKLAKEHDADGLMRLAKDVATRDAVKNKGAYFMTILARENVKPGTATPVQPQKPKLTAKTKSKKITT
jgi:hypothetical protein